MGGFPGFALGAQQSEEHRARQQQLEDEQRKATLKALLEDATTPADKLASIQAVYHKDPSILKQHVENLTRRMVGRKAQPVVSPEQAERARIAPIAARGKTPEQQALEAQRQEADQTDAQRLQFDAREARQKQDQTFALIDQYIKDPAENRQAKEDYVRKQAGIATTFRNLPGAAGQPYKAPNGQWVRTVESADGTLTEQPMPAGYAGPQEKPIFRLLKGHLVKMGADGNSVEKDFGPVAASRVTQRQSLQYDENGVPRTVTLTSVSMPGGESIDVEAEPNEGGSTAPAPRHRTAPTHPSAPRTPTNQLNFRRPTPASNKARADYAEAVKLSSMADQVAAHPNDAVNQKRLAVALERASAGRFTTQALDYIVKAGWGNTIEQWANNPTTGALPADIVRQLVDGAKENLKASKDAIDAVDSLGAQDNTKGLPAPKKSAGKQISDDDFLEMVK